MAVLSLIPILVVVVVVGSIEQARPPWEVAYLASAAAMLAAGTTFTVTAITIGMRHTAEQASSAKPPRNRSSSNIRVFGLVVLAANVAAVLLGGRINPLNLLLAVAVVALLLLLREHARREGLRQRRELDRQD